MVSFAETFPAPKVGLAFIQTCYGINFPFLKLEQIRPGTHQAVGQ
jgi:hypothetical protein